MNRATRLALVALIAACGGNDAPPPAPTVATAEPIRGGFSLEREGFTWQVRGETRVEDGARAATEADGRGGIRLDRGGWVLLDRQSAAVLGLDQIELQAGRAWIDARDAEIKVVTALGEIRAIDATFAVKIEQAQVEIYVGAGEISFVSGDHDGRATQGETLTLGSGEPDVSPAELWDDWTGGLADPTPRREAVPGYIGVLAGRGLGEMGKARRPVAIRAHEVDATVVGDFAVTEVIQTFFNAESQMLEAEYRMRIPEGAVVRGFGVDLGGGFVDAHIQPLVAQGYALAWDDPTVETSRLSYDGPGRLRARVHPIHPGATVRVRVRYAEWLDRRGDMRSYVYPMRTEGSAPPLVGELRIRVDTARANAGAYRAGMGARVDEGAVVIRRSDWHPTADFHLDLIDAEEDEEQAVGAAAYVVDAPPESGAEGDQRFVLFDVPTEGIAVDEDDEADSWDDAHGVDLVVLVDVSGATQDEDLELARAVVETVLRQLSPDDRVALRLGDVSAVAASGTDEGLALATEETREALLESLARVDLGGATDMAAMLRDAASVVAGSPRGAVLYVGDAIPTTGAMDTTRIRRALASIDDPPRFFGLAVGEGANIDLLRALFGESGAVSVAERTEASRAVMRILADAARPMLRNVVLDLGPSVERVFPRSPLVLPEGQALRVVGRLRDDLPTEIHVRGELDGRAFDRTIAVHAEPIADEGDIRRRWATARLQELVDEDAGREALVELGVRFEVLTPWTSLVAHGAKVDGYWLVRGFDDDPRLIDWALGGGAPTQRRDDRSGWRRRRESTETASASVVERTWEARVNAAEDARPVASDGGLALAAVTRALGGGERGPRACYERKLLVRPDLAGVVRVEIQVDGQGLVKDTKLVNSTLGAGDVDACILTEVRGIRYPATGGSTVTVTHTFQFQSAGRAMGVRRQCSDASRQSLQVRGNLWRERLTSSGGVRGALSVWRDAQRQCELSSWRARRTLLGRMLRHVGSVAAQVQLYHALAGDASIARYLRRAILRNVRTPQDVLAVRGGLGIDAPVDWSVFSRMWKRATDPQARLRLVRRWLEVIPEEMDLRLRLLALLEETERWPEAKRIARELRADPLADARVRAAVGEFWLRQEDEREARRVFSEIVETAPYDPWARRRLGDIYRAHGWYDDAYREYRALATLRPDDEGVLLLLARAAAGAGRIDEALRLEQRLSESVEPGHLEGVAGVARLWTTTRLAALKAGAQGDELANVRRRERGTGVLRNPPALLMTLTWAHPEDAPQLHLKLPSTPEEIEWERAGLSAPAFGLEAEVLQDPEDGVITLEVRREERDAIRDLRATLTIIAGLGSEAEQIHTREIVLTRQDRTVGFRLESGALTP